MMSLSPTGTPCSGPSGRPRPLQRVAGIGLGQGMGRVEELPGGDVGLSRRNPCEAGLGQGAR